MTTEYQQFLESKIKVATRKGLKVDRSFFHPSLRPDQMDIAEWGIELGAALVAPDAGMGKTRIGIEVMRFFQSMLGGKCLIVTELGAADTFVDQDPEVGEGAAMGIFLEYVTNQAEAFASKADIVVTNYERIRNGEFDFSAFAAVWLDEGNYIKNMASDTTEALKIQLAKVQYKYIATATPSPNEVLELINYAHVLGICDRGQILTRFFQRNSTKAGELTLHPHHTDDFWLWVHSWCLAVTSPSDLGYNYPGFELPELRLHWVEVKIDKAIDAGEKPLRKKKPTMYFVNSMSDLFHEAVPFEVIDKIYAVMGRCQHHIFQILTKRPERMLEYYKSNPYQRILNAAYQLNLPKNHSLGSGIDNPSRANWGWQHVWVGVSIEDQKAANERIPLLLQVPAAIRFLSCEPLLGPVDLKNIQGPVNRYQVLEPITNCGDSNRPAIDWVIVGGESGKGARPMYPDWIRSLRDQCIKVGTAFFFKQYGTYVDVNNILPVPMEDFSKNLKSGKWVGVDNTGAIVDHVSGPNKAILMAKIGKKEAGRLLDGREWNEFPVSGKRTAPVDDPDLHAGGFDY